MFKTVKFQNNVHSDSPIYSNADFALTMDKKRKHYAAELRDIAERLEGGNSVKEQLDLVTSLNRQINKNIQHDLHAEYRNKKFDYLRSIIVENTENNGIYGQQDLISATESYFRNNWRNIPYEGLYGMSPGFDPKMVMTVIRSLVNDGYFQCTQVGRNYFYKVCNSEF